MNNRTVKRLLSLVLVAALAMTLFVGSVSPIRAAAAKFSDVNGHWAQDSIARWMDEDVIHGYPDGTFRPNDKITRAEFATVLKNLLRLTEQAENPFPDLPDNWMREPVLCLVKEGIIKGYSDGTFKPSNKILRQEAFTMICRAFYFPEAEDADLSGFADGKDVSNYAKGYIKTLVDLGAIRGYPDGTILPKQPISRAEIMTVLDRLISLYVKENDTKDEAEDSFVLVVADNAVLTAPAGSYVIARRAWENLRVNCLPVDDEQLYLVPAERHIPAADAAVPATCTQTGLTEGSHCSFCGEVLTAQQEIPALGHLWGEASFEWDGFASATATRVCKRDESHIETVKCDITSKVTTEPTNAEAGARLYTAEAKFDDGTSATDQKTEILPPTGYTFGEPDWTWADDGSSAYATFTSKEDPDVKTTAPAEVTGVVTKQPTCTEAGETTYTATVTFNSETYTSTKTVADVDPLGHDWGEAAFTWNGVETAVATRNCKNDPSHKETVAAIITNEVTKEPTAEKAGERTYTATAMFPDGTKATDTKTEAIPATGYTYGSPDWKWEDDGSGASAVFPANENPAVKETVPADVTDKITKAATCTEAGETTYTAMVLFDGKLYTSTKVLADVDPLGHLEVTDPAVPATCTATGLTEGSHCARCGAVLAAQQTVSATGHNWGEPVFTWDGFSAVSAERICKNDSSHIDKAASCTDDGGVVTKAPTAAAEGEKTYTATAAFADGTTVTDTKKEILPATGYTYGEPTWTWSGDGTVAYATFTAAEDPAHKATVPADVTGETIKEPTCTEAGETKYTATAVFDGNNYTDTKTLADIDPLGHEEVTDAAVPATCTADGLTEGKHCSRCNAVLTAQETVPALGHDWGEPVFTWDGFTAVSAQRTCKNDASHVDTAVSCTDDGGVVTKEPTPEKEGEKVYTATASFADGTSATDTKTEILPATGYTYGDPEWFWADDRTLAYATFTSVEDPEHKVTIPAEITKVTDKEPTCTEPGEAGYIGTVTFNGETYTDNKTLQTQAALGHDWLAPVWHVAEDGTLTRVTHCSRCDETQEETFARKFLASVTDPNEVKVSGTAFDNYYATLVIPAHATVSSASAQILMEMTDVAGLGVEGTRSHTLTVRTGIEKEVLLDNWIGNLIALETLTVQGTIDGKPYSYALTREVEKDKGIEESYYAYLMTTDTAQTRTAWQALTAPLASTTQAADDSYILIKNGAYVQIGTEKLEFERPGDLKLDDIQDAQGLNAAMDAVRAAMRLRTGVAAAETPVEIFLPEGTTLALGNSVVTLQRDAKITAAGIGADGILSELQASSNAQMLRTALLKMNDAFAGMDGSTLTVNVEFCDHAHTGGDAVRENEKAATCTEAGSHDEVVYCTVCNKELSRTTVEDAATGHDWGEAVFTWNGFNAVSAERTCKNDSSHIDTAVSCTDDGGVVTKEPTPTVDGEKVYTATAVFDDGTTATDTKTETLPATGYTYGNPAWNWSDDYTSAEATFTAVEDPSQQVTLPAEVSSQTVREPTCTQAGETAITATVTFDGETYTDNKTMQSPEALGHDWLAPVWHVAEDGTLTKVTHCSRCDETQEETFVRKFLTSVTDPNKVKVSGAAFDNYYATLVIPAHATVSSASAQILLEMTDVAGLGVEGTRSHALTVQTGIEKEVQLDIWIQNLINLQKLTVQGTIDGKPYSYELTREVEKDEGKEESYYAYLMTTDTAQTRTAWQALTAPLKTSTQAADDSYILIKHGSYLQIGTEKLEFERAGDLKLDNIHDAQSMNEAMEAIRAAVQLRTGVTEAETPVEIFLPKGTTLALGSSVVTLERDAKITASGIEADGILSELQASSNTEMLKNALIKMNGALAGLNNGTLTVNVEFSDHEHTAGTAVRENEKAATCTEAGSHDEVVYCTVCEEEMSRTAVEDPALGHDFGEPVWHVAEDGTLTKVARCSRCGEVQKQTFARKFLASVTDPNNVKVSGAAFDNYYATFVIPANATVSSASAQILLEMTDVAGLGVEGTRRHTLTVQTGIEKEVQLDSWIQNMINLQKLTVQGTIDGKPYSYELTREVEKDEGKEETYYAYLMTTDTAQTQTAWQALTAPLKTTTQAVDDSYILIKHGAYVQIGTEKLEFERGGDLRLDNIHDAQSMNAAMDAIRAAVQLRTGVTAAETPVEIFLPKGTALALGSSVVTLERDAKITAAGIEADGVLSEMQASSNAEMLKNALIKLNEAFYGMNGKTLTVNVEFSDHEHTAGEAVRENEKAATCTEAGSHDEVVYCTLCGEEMSRTAVKDEALGHDFGEPVWHVAEDGTLTKVARCSRCGETQEETFARKFLASVTDPNNVKVSGTAFDNYYATLVIPAHATVSSASAQILLEMTDVAGLGVEGTRSHALTVQTGIEKEVQLDSWIQNLINLQKLTVQGTIDGKPYSYELTREVEQDEGKEESYYAYLMTTDTAQTQTAWQALTAPLKTSTQAADDSYILIKHGAYVQIGTEKLEFERAGDLKLDNIYDAQSMNAAMDAIRAAVQLRTGVAAAETPVEIFLPKGTALALGSSVVTLERDAKITASGIEADGLLSELQASSNAETLKNALIKLNGAFYDMDGKTLTVNVEFSDHVHVEGAAVRENEKAATCTVAGSHDEVVYCTVCEEELSRTAVEDAALGHDWGEWKVTTEPTCTEAGVETRTCARCGETETRAADALGHDWGETYYLVKEDGVLVGMHKCSRCAVTEQTNTFSEKIYAAVADGDQSDKVIGTAFDNYYLTFVMPKSGDNTENLDMSAAYLWFRSDISGAELPVISERKVNTPWAGETASLENWLSSVPAFESGNIHGTVNGNSYSYDLSIPAKENENYYAILAETDTDQARACWRGLMDDDSIYTSEADTDGTAYVLLRSGSYVQIGTEKLRFEDNAGDLKVGTDYLNNIPGLIEKIKSTIVLDTDVNAAETDAEIFLRAGSVVELKDKLYTLRKDVTVTVDNLDMTQFSTLLSDIRTSANGGDLNQAAWEISQRMIQALNGFIGSLEQDGGVELNVNFSEHIHEYRTEYTVEAGGQLSKTETCWCGEVRETACAEKFFFSVTDKSGATTAAASAFDNYFATFVLPKAASVDYSGATLFARMTDVESLGIEGTRSHEFQIATGMNGEVQLENWFDLSGFEGGTVSGTIDGIPYEYSLSNASPEDGNYYAILAETDSDQTRAAWQALAGQIDPDTQKEDSYVLLKNGSTIQIGTELLSFESDDDLRLDNLNDLNALQDAVRSRLQLTTGAAAGEGQIVIVLKAGTQLAVGGSVATLKHDAKIVVSGMSKTANLDTLLSSLRNTDDVETMVKKLVYSVGDFANSVNSGGITVNVTFSDE